MAAMVFCRLYFVESYLSLLQRRQVVIQCRQILSTDQEERNNGMKAYVKELVAKQGNTYFIAVYTRHGKDTGYAPTRICRQIKTLPRARR